MKKLTLLTYSILLFSGGSLGAEECCESTPGPFNIAGYANSTGNAKIREPGKFSGGAVRYGHADIEGSVVWYYDPECGEAADFLVGYSNSLVRWEDNPFFDKTTFHTVRVGIGGLSNRLEDWLWRGRVIANIDADHWQRDYMTYDLFLWGRYDYCQDIGVHLGFYGLTGMRIDRVYPILGFDWAMNEKWQLNVIFPMDISLTYLINDCWNAALVWRPFLDRHRVGESEPLSEALWFYQSSGAELAFNYTVCDWLSANVHVGGLFGGELKISNRDYRHKRHIKLKGAGYFGGEFVVNF